MAQRAKIFEPTPLDVSDFNPRTEAEPRPDAEQIDRVSGPKFRSREVVIPSPLPSADPRTTEYRPYTKRQPMVYRTGRNVTFSAKTTQATVDAFYEIAQQQGWKAGETFEKAVEALQRQLENS
jgi:hypothetical protein